MRTARSRRTVWLVAALLLTACGDGIDLNEIVPAISESDSDGGDAAGGDGTGDGQDGDATDADTGGDSADAGTDPGGTDDGGTGDGADAGGDSGDGAAPAASTNDFGGVGTHGPAMLRSSVASLIVEVDVQQGVAVSQEAVDTLVSRIRQYVDKPGGVSLSGGNTFASDTTQWTRDQLRAVAQANRSHYSDGSTVVVYVIYADGGFYSDGQETSAIGVAYNASEFAVFPDRWAGLGSLLGSDRAIERAVLVHEWGHLLGLVNITYSSNVDHEDPEHPHHSSNRGSVMFWAIETDAISQFFSGPPPDDFDDADRQDMEGLRDGSLT